MFEFDKVYVNCVEDESLFGKYGFFADSIEDLKRFVTNNSLAFWGKLSAYKSGSGSFPFVNENDELQYRYFYYDPKLYIFFGDNPGRLVTHRELSRWLAHGNGEGIYTIPPGAPHLTFTEFRYLPGEGDKHVQGIMVRRWDEDEWQAPTTTYFDLESSRED